MCVALGVLDLVVVDFLFYLKTKWFIAHYSHQIRFEHSTFHQMPIDLGLSRVVKLLSRLGNPHNSYKSIHIAGTNGKGSTLAYLSSIFTSANVRNGRFTSPHLLYYNDCICIDNKTYPVGKFEEVKTLVNLQNEKLSLGCTEFELLTVTAFKIFELEKVELAIIEVGLGGRLDATNVLAPVGSEGPGGVIVSAITKIGFDHESFLGNTLAAIASEKAGIIKPQVPVVADKTNDDEALGVIAARASLLGAELHLVDGKNERVETLLQLSPLKGDYQMQNLGVSLEVLDVVNRQKHGFLLDEHGNPKTTSDAIKTGIMNTVWPGRLQSVNIDGLEVLLDGAHNESAAIELGKYLRQERDNNGIIFVIALSRGKSIGNLLKHITDKDKDTIFATEFSVPDQMPWVSSYKGLEVQTEALQYVSDSHDGGAEIARVLAQVAQLRALGDARKVVICGSLYLCADVLRYKNSI